MCSLDESRGLDFKEYAQFTFFFFFFIFNLLKVTFDCYHLHVPNLTRSMSRQHTYTHTHTHTRTQN